jgi:hypothetical protein
MDEENTVNYFYFKSDDSSKIFFIESEYLNLVPLFETFYSNKSIEDNVLEPVIFRVIKHDDTISINTTTLLDYIVKYVSIWKLDSKSENYIKETPVLSGNPATILKSTDLIFLENYISECKNKCDLRRYSDDLIYQKHIKISVLSELLVQSEGYLGMIGLPRKIYAYIAALIWNTSIIDIAAAGSDSYFLNLE